MVKMFWRSNKNKEETWEAVIKMSKNNDYTTANLLDYESFSNHCKLIATDLSKQTALENPDLKQQINFSKLILLASLKKIMKQQCFSSFKTQKKLLSVFRKTFWVSYKMET